MDGMATNYPLDVCLITKCFIWLLKTYSKATVANLFGARDQFQEGQFFQTGAVVGVWDGLSLFHFSHMIS